MSDPSFIILYVESPAQSAAFYTGLLGKQPVESSPGFAMFALESGVMLGLWARHTVQPPVQSNGSTGELCFPVADANVVQEMHREWGRRGIPIAQQPTDMDFGHTFVALDPDGHRLRVFAPSAR